MGKSYSKEEVVIAQNANGEANASAHQSMDALAVAEVLLIVVVHRFTTRTSVIRREGAESREIPAQGVQVTRSTESSKMADESFNLKTAIALLPVMTGKEQVTLQLIDGIQLYSSMITDNTKNQLIEFVLKTRLSEGAKLRLKSTYRNVESLVIDMRKHLIQKKSAVAIQSQLSTTKQGHRSIENYGNELEKLFVDLTIAQADGDDTKFGVLRPINEKIAIKRFSDGLSDPRLSTIVASRQFESLPEAIRAAVDEQTLSSDNNPVMNVRRFQNYRGNRRGFTNKNRGTRNYFQNRNQPFQSNFNYRHFNNTLPVTYYKSNHNIRGTYRELVVFR
ncbi:uncharacterized protein LOC135117650 [Helicoverpa armigera]|uniref:uncharacterized protein LOC135117650 n=1 Tax=Helicoverpa armigera TaxID=29058 RepID=UPI00308304E9